MRWMLSLDGGPKRVNHASVAIGDKIYSFGGYTATEVSLQNDFIDVHVLNTFTYRWQRLPVFPVDTVDGKKSRRSVTISGPSPEEGPSTSQSPRLNRRRARSLSNTHPLAQIREANPPLDDESPRLFHPITSHTRYALGPIQLQEEEPTTVPQEEQMFSDEQNEHLLIREQFEGIEQHLLSDDEEALDYEVESEASGSADEVMDTDEDDSDEEDEEEESRMLVQLEGFGELELPVGVDIDQLRKLQQHPEIPFKRYGHTVVSYNGQVYLWGGRNDIIGCRQTLHRYDPASNRWSLVPAQGQYPPARDGHSAVVWADSMYIFGGYEEREMRYSQETYVFHFPSGTWTKLKTQGEPPQYRDFHSACVLDGKMFVFGGRSDENGQSHSSHDFYDASVHFLDVQTQRWHLANVQPGEMPCGRRSHTMWTYEGCIYLFGGFESINNKHFNDLWRFDPGTSKWTELKTTGQGPSPRRRQCTVMVGSRLFLFGGTMPNPKKKTTLEDMGDLFVLDFSPSLASLCLESLRRNGLSKKMEAFLPEFLKLELHYLSTPNQLSKSEHRLGHNMRG